MYSGIDDGALALPDGFDYEILFIIVIINSSKTQQLTILPHLQKRKELFQQNCIYENTVVYINDASDGNLGLSKLR